MKEKNRIRGKAARRGRLTALVLALLLCSLTVTPVKAEEKMPVDTYRDMTGEGVAMSRAYNTDLSASRVAKPSTACRACRTKTCMPTRECQQLLTAKQ